MKTPTNIPNESLDRAGLKISFREGECCSFAAQTFSRGSSVLIVLRSVFVATTKKGDTVNLEVNYK